MKLHLDRVAFLTLIQQIAESSGYRLDVLEKDYYVVLMLKELSDKQKSGIKAYFKGGTAIYKIFEKLNRFSEDIDLTVNTAGLSGDQHRKHLRSAAKDYSSLEFITQEYLARSSRTCIFGYQSLFELDLRDQLQRFGKVKIEATTFTKSEPIEKHRISPILYSLSNVEFQNILKYQYDVEPFEIETLSLPRIFIDKIYALENRLRKEEYFDAAKHAYDLYQLFTKKEIKDYVLDCNLMKKLIAIQRVEELERQNSIIQNVKMCDFVFSVTIQSSDVFIRYFEDMQSVYIFHEADRVQYQDMSNVLIEIHSYLLTID